MPSQNLDIHVGVTGGEQAGGVLESLAMKARQLRREDAKSGEGALGGFLNQGAGGLANLGLSAVGLGAVGMVADFAAKSADSLMTSLQEVSEGKKTLTDAVAEFAKGIPVIGSIGTALSHFFDILGGKATNLEEFNRRADERTQHQIDQGQKDADVNTFSMGFGKAADRAFRDALASPLQLARNHIQDELHDSLDKISEQRNSLPLHDITAFGRPATSSARQASFDKINQAEIQARELASVKLAKIDQDQAAEESAAFVKREEMVKEQEQTFSDIHAESRRAVLEANGQALDMELEQIRKHAEDRRTELAKQTLGDIVSERKRAAAMVDIATEEAAQIAEAQRKAATQRFVGDYSARGQLISAKAALLRLNGNGNAANQMETAESFNSQIRALALSYGDPSTDAYQKQAALQSIAAITATRNATLAHLYDTGLSYSNRAAGASTDRFTTGATDALLSKTAAVDTAKNTRDLLKKQDDILKVLQSIDRKGGGVDGILSAIGNGGGTP